MQKLKMFLLSICLVLPAVAFFGCNNANRNMLATPTDLTVSTGGNICFVRVDKDEFYTININDVEVTVVVESSNPNVELFSRDNKNYLIYNASKIMTLGESYNVKVKAHANKKADSEFSSTVTYTHTLPIEKPSNIKITGNVLTWDVVEHASFYLVKVITPSDKIIYDYDGNIINSDDAETIKSADLTSYQFSTNRFDFSTITTEAGVYKFYINAISADGVYEESGYTLKTTYLHRVQLATPTISGIYSINEFDEKQNGFVDNLHLTTVLDENATAIEIECDNLSSTQELVGTNNAISKVDNVFDINLNKYFENVEVGGKIIDFSELKTYRFRIRAIDPTQQENEKFYINSSFSDNVDYSLTAHLTNPQASIAYNELNQANVLSWQVVEAERDYITGFNLYLVTEDRTTVHKLSAKTNNFTLPTDVIAVSVQTVGKGGMLTSKLSEPVSVLSGQEITGAEISINNGIVSWTSLPNATYIVEIGEEVFVQTSNELNLLSLSNKAEEISITYAVKNYLPVKKTFKLNYSIRLATPTIQAGQGFASTNNYLLTFTGVDHAIGYYVYLTGKGMSEAVKIPQVFTTTSINLSNYLINQGEYSEYQVQIQAVADKYSGYSDSVLTEFGRLQVTHSRVLAIPEFKKDAAGNIAPIEKVGSGENVNYYLNFFGVDHATRYEIMINYNKITQLSDQGMGLYRINITNYLTSANSYTIMVRALPNDGSANIKPSDYNKYTYVLTKQLDLVENIIVAENDGIYTLSFEMQENAVAYRVRIVKLNDGNYESFLASQNLAHPFEVIQSVDITDYVTQAGVYYIYVTALASKNGYYGDSDESVTYGEVNKLTSLATPTDLQYRTDDKDSFLIRWTGDEHADYYMIKVKNPLGEEKIYSYNRSNDSPLNINPSISVEGDYLINIKAMVNPTGENAKLYTSSPYSEDFSIHYVYTNTYDYERYSVYMYGNEYDFRIENVEELKNILWYHLLFGVDETYNLNLYVQTQTEESTRDAILRLATEANNQLLHNFSADEVWLGMLDTANDSILFRYLCEKLLAIYPEMAVVDELSIKEHASSNVFKVFYKNTLNEEKQAVDEDFVRLAKDYGNDYVYLDRYARRGANSSFAIDSRPEMNVETTEQLLHAVMYGKKPKFIGDSLVAETVYANAKNVLITIANNNMTEVEKVTAIYDWLQHALNLNYYADYVYDTNNDLIQGSLEEYGLRSEYYLEGLFLNLGDSSVGGFDGEFYLGNKLATDELYAKAFALLCSIEGIQTIKVTGDITKINNNVANRTHTWNKIYLDVNNDGNKDWFNVDLTYSDNYVITYDVEQSYSAESHIYFLVSDSFLYENLGATESGRIISSPATKSYNYYENSYFTLTANQIKQTVNANVIGEVEDFIYLKQFVNDLNNPYQKYAPTSGYDELQAFILNALFSAKHKLLNNSAPYASFEIKISEKDMGGTVLQGGYTIGTMVSDFNNKYSNRYSENVRAKYYTSRDTENKATTYVVALEFIGE